MILFSILRDVCLPLMLLFGIGWFIDRRFSIDLNTLVKLNLYLFVPAFIFVRVSSSTLPGAEGGKVVGLTLCVIGLMAAASWLVTSLRGESSQARTSLQLSTMFYNSGNWGIPLMALAFGEHGTVLQVFVLMTMNVTTFSVGIFLAGSHSSLPGTSRWKHFLPMLRQPSLYAIFLALLMRSLGNPLANVAFIWAPLNYLADALVAFALITLGVQLSKTKPPAIGGRLAWALGLRLLGGPVAALGLTWLFGFRGEAAAILIIGAASPTAVNTALLAHEFQADSRFVSAVVFYSTLAAVVVVTLWLALVKAGMVPWA